MTFGIVTIAIGEKAKQENKLCLESINNSLQNINKITLDKSNLPDTIVPNKYCQATEVKTFSDMQYSRLLKVNLINCIPKKWQYCIYLDSDTRLMSKDIFKILDVLKSGYDICIVPSQSQDFWHIGQEEKNNTILELGYHPIQLQCGVFGFRVNDVMREFFLRWSNNYLVYCNQDQMQFVKTLHEIPIKYWLMGFPFNSSNGTVVKHLFGRTR